MDKNSASLCSSARGGGGQKLEEFVFICSRLWWTETPRVGVFVLLHRW